MSIEVKVPQLPESVSDATLVAWHKSEGDSVSRDENLVDLETDKVVLEVPAARSGKITKILVKDGATVTTGDVLAIIEEGEGGGDATDGKNAAKDAPKDAAESKVAGASKGKSSTAPAKRTDADDADDDDTDEGDDAAASDEGQERSSGAAKLSPAVRRLVEENDLDINDISGSGRDGRITKGDVLDHLERHSEGDAETGSDQVPAAAAAASGRNDRRVPMTRLRSRIAERLVQAQQTAAMLTTFNEIDLTEVMALRQRHKDGFEKAHGVKLGFMSFFVRASVEALQRFPAVNASIEGSDIVYHDYHDIGIAVSTDRGLLVPVLRDAGELPFAEIEKAVVGFGTRARDGQITMDELTGGTFTITNGGVFGSMLSTPILNPPQSAILGMHKIQERAMVVNGEIVARPMMYVALTYDHRIIDGREAVQFLVSIKDSLEDPARLLLGI
ncbi:MAG: 2-oxoglutarate dehydrogenase complex dihydrolipoyllysine-residue succinyltransferase [Gammaproteobacteria bacterium]|nr:2-oxoglutarate dehydrogenase complex dihydrolipoyllysine-residue succinyltransferase [Gammaproteobacteria bacterium]